MSLDKMYGKGTAVAFAAVVNLATLFPKATTEITEAEMENGGVYVEVVWKTSEGGRIGIYKLEYEPTTVHCGSLEVEPAYQGKGLLTILVEAIEPFWVSIGLKQHTLWTAPGSTAEKQLALCGFGPLPGGRWGVELPAIKAQEYIAWVKKGSPSAKEPAWRAALPKPTNEIL